MADTDTRALPAGYALASGVGEYRIEKILGSGGFGITYLTVSAVKVGNVTAEVRFALKEHFPAAYCRREDDGTVVPRKGCEEEYGRSAADFEAEARRLQKYGVDCDNIVKVNEVFKANGTVYYVMQYIDGRSLADYVTSRGSLSLREAKAVMGPVFDAVTYLHSKRVNHLDIKPENIMLQKAADGVTPVLIDFGLSVHFKKSGGKTSPKGLQGVTEGFAPLEQYAGLQEFSPATDVYALAATFIYCLTGKVPAKASELRLADVRKVLDGKMEDDELEGLCRALHKSSDDRTPSAAKLKSDLDIATGGGDSGTVVIDTDGGGRFDGRLRWLIVALAAVAVALLAWWKFAPGNADAEQAEDIQDQTEETIDTVALDTVPVDPVAVDTVVTPVVVAGEADKEDVLTPIPNPEPKPKPETTPKPEMKQETATNGTLSLGYATWSGGIRGGKPHGSGRMTFHSAHAVDRHSSAQAEPGDYFIATYDNGTLSNGKLYGADGTLKKTIIP